MSQTDHLIIMEKSEVDTDFSQSGILLQDTKATSCRQPIKFAHSFNPSLEGLRGIAVLLTLFCHIIESPFILREASGSMGVTIFFVLSGFLITGVLLRMQDENRNTSPTSRKISYQHLQRFYMDRTVRLAPALIFMISSFYFLHSYYNPNFIQLKGYCLVALAYMQNFHGTWPEKGNPGPFGHMWSLACEEQYYIIWAFALPYLCRMNTKKRALTLWALISLSFFARISTSMYPGTFFGAHWHDSLWTNVWKMLIGSMLRLVPIPATFADPSFAYLGIFGLAGTLCAMMGPQPIDYWSPKYGPGWHDLAAGAESWTDPLTAICAVLIILGVQGPKGGLWILENKPIRFAGKVSYAWYLWQASLLVLSGWQRYYPACGDTAIAFMAAMVSTFLIEEPIGIWYKNFKQRTQPKVSLVH